MLRILAGHGDGKLIVRKVHAGSASQPRVIRGCAHLLAKAAEGFLPYVAHGLIGH